MKETGDYDANANDAAFERYLTALRGQVGEAKYKSWFLDLGFTDCTDRTVTLSTPTKSKRDILDNRYLPLLIDLWRREVGPVDRVRLTVRANALKKHAAKVNETSGAAPKASAFLQSANGGYRSTPSDNLPKLSAPLDPRRSFETLANGHSNRLAEASVRQAIAPNSQPEVVYIFGESGVGKTHLLQAACQAVAGSEQHSSGLYVTYRNMINACVSAVLSNQTQALQEMFLASPVVAIDDVHFLEGKDRTQEELLIVIDALIDSGRSIIVAGDRAPSKLVEAGINKRLADRLAGGLCAQVAQADEEMRLDILRKRAAASDATCKVDSEVLEFIARNFADSTREAIGALNQVLLIFRNEQMIVGLDDARDFLDARLRDQTVPKVATIEDAITAGADAFGLTSDDVLGRAQPQRIVRARHAIVFCAREVLSESFPRIGKALGRDHTTVMSSYRRAQALIERDKAFQEGVRRIKEALGR